ncbi:MAG: hypothetical protein BroJett015_26450 [Chloroflexota bacterium]|nr:MAG: hypothetical protein BroJett015_26450 [Chloroflexota bacterium]
MATMTLNEIHQVGLAALSRELGPVGMVRFLQMFETGYGDYSQERTLWLKEQPVETIAERIKRRRIEAESE